MIHGLVLVLILDGVDGLVQAVGDLDILLLQLLVELLHAGQWILVHLRGQRLQDLLQLLLGLDLVLVQLILEGWIHPIRQLDQQVATFAHLVADVVDQLHGAQGLVREVCRAVVGAARALGAGVGVQQRLPVEALVVAHAPFLLIFQVTSGQHALLPAVAKKDVGQRAQQVDVLGVGDVVEEEEHDDHVDHVVDVGGRLASPCQAAALSYHGLEDARQARADHHV